MRLDGPVKEGCDHCQQPIIKDDLDIMAVQCKRGSRHWMLHAACLKPWAETFTPCGSITASA